MTIDGIFEGTETFDMTLQALSSARLLGVEVGTQGTAIGEIIDAGIPSIKLFLTKCQHTEQGTYVIIASIQHTLQIMLTIICLALCHAIISVEFIC